MDTLDIFMLQQLNNPWKFAVNIGGNQTLSSSGTVPFNSTVFDPTSLWNNSSASWTVPTNGYYLLGFVLNMTASQSVDVTVAFQVGGNTVGPPLSAALGSSNTTSSLVFLWPLSQGQLLNLNMSFGSSSTVTFTTGTMFAHLLSPTSTL